MKPDLCPVWRVNGFRQLAGGGSVEMLATALGSTEEKARAFFHRVVNKPHISNGTERRIWADHELTFTREGGEQ